MTGDERGSSSALPQGDYTSSTPGYYRSVGQTETRDTVATQGETVRLVASGERAIITYDPRERARRRLIRYLNEF
jgi:hypothetical protein